MLLLLQKRRIGKLIPITRRNSKLIRVFSELTSLLFSVVLKVGMIGDSQIGKTSLMVKYVEGSFDEDYIQTLGKTSLFNHHSRTIPKKSIVGFSTYTKF